MAVDQTPAATPVAAPAQPAHAAQPNEAAPPSAQAEPKPVGFGARGRVRRRARFLRKARELAYRDLGGLVYSLHRFGQRNDSLVLAKLATLTRIDAELRGLEASLSERQPVTVLREAGITACPRCAAIHSGEDRFCPNCGLALSRNVDLPIAGGAAERAGAPAPATPAGAPAVAAPPEPGPAASPAPAPTAAPAYAAPSSAATASFAPIPATAPAPTPPATQSHQVTPPATQTHQVAPTPGRAPVTAPQPANADSRDGEDDQPTEIIRPPAHGS